MVGRVEHRSLEIMVMEGERFPRGYGFAYRDFDRNRLIALPIPLNLLVGRLRNLWHWCRARLDVSVIDKARSKGRREASLTISEMRARVAQFDGEKI